MAIFNGTQVADTISGTIDDDIIMSGGGDDVINAAGGNDQINGGAGADNILAGAGDDTITVDSIDDLMGNNSAEGAITRDIIDGGDDTDTLVTGLRAGDVLNQGAPVEMEPIPTGGPAPMMMYSSGPALWGVEGVITQNLEFVQVSNASDFMLDLSQDTIFATDLNLTFNDGDDKDDVKSNGPRGQADVLSYDAETGEVHFANNADMEAGVIIDGETYGAGDTYMSADGGEVFISFRSVVEANLQQVAMGMIGSGSWLFSYRPAPEDLLAVGDSSDPSDDIITTFVATITNNDEDGSTVDVTVNLGLNLDEDYNASESSVGVTSPGDGQDNSIVGSDFNDVIFAGGAVDSGMDIISGLAGNDTLGGGDDNDNIYGGDDNDVLFLGAGDDYARGGYGNDIIWGGAGTDTIYGDVGSNTPNGNEGDDIIGGGDGGDYLYGEGGNDAIFAGSDDGQDNLFGGNGNDTLFAGDGDDFTIEGGDGNDTIFNGAGNDLNVSGGAGDDTLWGGAGDDTLDGGADDDVFAFVAGNGNDTVSDFGFDDADPNGNDVLDLSAFSFADTQAVIDAMSNNPGGDAILAIAPGQTIIFTGNAVSDFQAAVDDWVLV